LHSLVAAVRRQRRPEISSIKEAHRYAHNIESKNYQLLLRLLKLETDPSIKKLFLDALQMHKSNLNHLVERMIPIPSNKSYNNESQS